MVLTKEQRCELLVKARAKKKEMAELKKNENLPSEPKPKVKAKKQPEPSRTLDLSVDELLQDPKDNQVEIKNEVIRIKAPKKKTIIKRVIEVEEPSSDEEIQEEIIKVPRKNKIYKEQQAIKEIKQDISVVKEPAYLKYMNNIFPKY